MKLLGEYRNGNVHTRIYDDGTKVRETDDDEFRPAFAENMDVKICNRCDAGCSFCHEGSTPNGKLSDILHEKFIDSLHPYTEIAYGGGNVFEYPDLIPLLQKMKERKIIVNVTVNQIHFEQKEDVIRNLVDRDLVKGIGISLRKPTPEFIRRVKQYPNAVIHTINGILSAEDIEAMRDQDLKLLILGYKNLGRGVDYKANNELNIKARQKYLYDILPTLPSHFKLVSFDNLALEQLNVKRILTPEEWEETYMGDEGSSSMYIDLVKGKFGISSLCTEDEMWPIMDDIRDMFKIVKEKAKESAA